MAFTVSLRKVQQLAKFAVLARRFSGNFLPSSIACLRFAYTLATRLAPPLEGDLIALDAALDALAKVSSRQALMVEYRFFGGFEVSEIAAQLGVSEATVLRDWRAVKAWLAAELRSGPGGE